uniref:DUF4012 domain-containing protein n=1 Tax=Thermosporothrix sp. COM3 TaxID=2490863 RepID=A0A455SP61_9CHLR|nr:hypothetical protein KTC_39490 [Thermosporothrix sp. COM3]
MSKKRKKRNKRHSDSSQYARKQMRGSEVQREQKLRTPRVQRPEEAQPEGTEEAVSEGKAIAAVKERPAVLMDRDTQCEKEQVEVPPSIPEAPFSTEEATPSSQVENGEAEPLLEPLHVSEEEQPKEEAIPAEATQPLKEAEEQPKEGEAIPEVMEQAEEQPEPLYVSEEKEEQPKEEEPESSGEEEKKKVALPETVQTREGKVQEAAAVPAVAVVDEQAEKPETKPGEAELVPGPKAPIILRKLPLSRRLSIGVRLALVFCLLAPLCAGVIYGVNAWVTYTSLRAHAENGVQHLLNMKTLLAGSGSTDGQSMIRKSPSSMLDASTLKDAKEEVLAAKAEFEALKGLLNDSAVIHHISQWLPQFEPQITSAKAASQIGIELTDIAQIALDAGIQLAPRFRGPLLANEQKPLVTSTDLQLLQQTLQQVMPRLDKIEQQTRLLSLDALPLDTAQRNQLQQYVLLLPQVRETLGLLENMMGVAGWLLGVDTPRTFLVQTMDRGELRATGGFTGQFGELKINGGRVAPFSLTNVALIEYAPGSPNSEQDAPKEYRSWWPFANWGLRDANLSADFPASAKIIMQAYKDELKKNVDGVIMFTPFLIEHMLQVIGPLSIPKYNETVTAENLEDRLHYYQLDNAGILKIKTIEHIENNEEARKVFTSLVAQALMARIRNASFDELLVLGVMGLQNLKTKDLQIYFANEQAQQLLSRYGYAAEIDRSTDHDAFYLVQTNVSASKASQYVRTLMKDTVTLDAQGGATHMLQIRLAYNQLGSVYGLDTYRDYIRLYVPPDAKFLWGNGFDTGEPLCGGTLGHCPAQGIYPGQELICPTDQYEAGASAPMIGDPYYRQWHPLNKIGPPNNFKSDIAGRAMFGGYLVVPKNCTMLATIAWYVPPQKGQQTGVYDLLVQRQAGTFPELDLTLQKAESGCATMPRDGLYYNGVMTQDMLFKLDEGQHEKAASCPEKPAVAV